MPKAIAGHEGRCREVSAVASRIIARGRIGALTVRDLASEAGYSTHVVSHYFDNKEDLLIHTLRDCAARQVVRLKAAIRSGADVAGCLSAMLPLDEERMIDSRVWMVFWPYALSDNRYKIISDEFGSRWRHLMIGMLRLRGIIRFDTPRADRDFLGRRLQLILAGVSVHGTLGVWTHEQQITLLREHVELVLESCTREESPDSLPAISTITPGGTTSSDVERHLTEENKRLRELLVEAMLSADLMKEKLAKLMD